MKVSAYLAERLAAYGVRAVFGYQGSSVSHIIDSLSVNENIEFVETRHEQAAAFAANGYVLAGADMGVAVSCSGPGVTNMVTGIADAYFDSLPCLFIAGQVSVHELKTDPGMRQLGFQEMDVVSLVSSIVKYAVTVRQPEKIAYELEKAVYEMRRGRPGPVLLDIPHNVQGANIDVDALEHFLPEEKAETADCDAAAAEVARDLACSTRPVVLLGGGCRELRKNRELRVFLEELGIPVVTSYRGKDAVSNLGQTYCGTLGVYGDRCANWAVKYCDYLLVLGSRLDGRQTGDGQEKLAENAQVTVVDLDPVELRNMPDRYRKVAADAMDFLSALRRHFRKADCGPWLELVKSWRSAYPDSAEYRIREGVNPNLLLNTISRLAPEDAVFALDVGQNQLWGNTSLHTGEGQCILQSCGLGSMGFALPAAVGGCYATRKTAVCVCGDGGFQMNLQELQTVAHHNVPVKIFVMNNQSLGLIRIYQNKALQGRCYGSVIGFGSPDYEILAKAYGLSYEKIQDNAFEETVARVLSDEKPCLVEVCISPESTNYPEPTYRSTIDNQSVELSEEEKTRIKEDAYGVGRN